MPTRKLIAYASGPVLSQHVATAQPNFESRATSAPSRARKLRRTQQWVSYDHPRQNRSECLRSESQLLCLLPKALHEPLNWACPPSLCSWHSLAVGTLGCARPCTCSFSLRSTLGLWVQVSPPLPTVRTLTTPLLVHAQRSQLSLQSDHSCTTLIFLNDSCC